MNACVYMCVCVHTCIYLHLCIHLVWMALFAIPNLFSTLKDVNIIVLVVMALT